MNGSDDFERHTMTLARFTDPSSLAALNGSDAGPYGDEPPLPWPSADNRPQPTQRQAKKPSRPSTPPPSTGKVLDVVWADDISFDPNVVDLIDGVLPSEGITVIYGAPGASKTFTAIDLACRVATAGMDWQGREIERGVVIYIAGEAPLSVERRVIAWRQHHEVAGLDLVIVRAGVDFISGDATAIIELGQRIATERGQVAMVVADTLAATMHGNENAGEDMGRYVAACGAMRQALGCNVVVVHHSGKDEARGARGHSSLKAATDVEIEVADEGDGQRSIKVHKSRDDVAGAVFGARLERVEIGTNRKGRVVASCVAVATEAPAIKDKAKRNRLSDTGKVALEALRVACIEGGSQPPAHSQTKGVKVAVTVDRWRLYFAQVSGADDDEVRSSTFRNRWARGHDAAIAKGLARVWGGYAWIVQRGP